MRVCYSSCCLDAFHGTCCTVGAPFWDSLRAADAALNAKLGQIAAVVASDTPGTWPIGGVARFIAEHHGGVGHVCYAFLALRRPRDPCVSVWCDAVRAEDGPHVRPCIAEDGGLAFMSSPMLLQRFFAAAHGAGEQLASVRMQLLDAMCCDDSGPLLRAAWDDQAQAESHEVWSCKGQPAPPQRRQVPAGDADAQQSVPQPAPSLVDRLRVGFLSIGPSASSIGQPSRQGDGGVRVVPPRVDAAAAALALLEKDFEEPSEFEDEELAELREASKRNTTTATCGSRPGPGPGQRGACAGPTLVRSPGPGPGRTRAGALVMVVACSFSS